MSLQIQQDNDTYKVICQQCQHYIRVDKASAENYDNNPETFQCELCYVKEGEPKHLTRKFVHCATCNQTFDSKSSCDCQIPVSTITIQYDPKNKWMKHNRVNEQQEEAKTNREFNKIVRNRKLEAEQRQIRVDENLQKTVELLEKIVKQKESKDVQEK